MPGPVAPPPRNAVDAPAEPIYGREPEVARIVAAFADGARVVTLTGAAGIGKSCLARHALAAVGDGLRVVICPLADAGDDEGRMRELRRLRARRRVGGGKPELDAVGRALAEGPATLVVLDDADGGVAWAARLVGACLAAGPHARFLVTSREPLRIEAEHVVDVGPLAPDAARAMFAAIAGEVPEDDVTALLALLDGIPLAIELAARRAHLLSPAQWVSRIDERFRLLRSDRRDVPERHASLAAALEGSWERMDADERRAFSALGVFAGPIPLEAFEAVVGPLLGRDPIDVAEALLQKSMITSVPSSGAARLDMLGTLRAFARVRGSDARDAEERHGGYYLERAERSAATAYGPRAEEALDELEADLPNLLAAFARARAGAPARAARIAIAIGDLAIARDVVALHSPLFADARAAADASDDAELMARTRILEAKVELELGRARQAEALLNEAEARSVAAALPGTRADVLRSLGWARLALGRGGDAETALTAALDLYAGWPRPRGQADALAARAMVRWGTGDGGGAREDLEAAYAIHVVCDDAIRREAVADMAAIAGVDLRHNVPAEETSPARDRLRASAEAHRAAGRAWRAALDHLRLAALASSPAESDGEIELARAVASVVGTNPAVTAAFSTRSAAAAGATARGVGWHIGPEARWVIAPGQERPDLTRFGSMRRVLDVLVARRLEAPGSPTSAAAILEAAWRGERVGYESGMLRVYTAVRRLRAFGLGDALITRDDGYLLSVDVAFERAPA